jgi:hypothetical protein
LRIQVYKNLRNEPLFGEFSDNTCSYLIIMRGITDDEEGEEDLPSKEQENLQTKDTASEMAG